MVQLADIDPNNVVYASACGLHMVDVEAGFGESSAFSEVFGIEVIDTATGDLDGSPGDEVAVLVDCLGADSYVPHLLVFDARSVLAGTNTDTPVLAAVSGGSVAPGARPVSLRHTADGLQVTVAERNRQEEVPATHEVSWAPHVLLGAELVAPPSQTIWGVVAAIEPGADGVMVVVALAPDDGYRIPAPDAMTAVDPDTGESLALADLVGRPVEVATDAHGVATALTVMPAGGV